LRGPPSDQATVLRAGFLFHIPFLIAMSTAIYLKAEGTSAGPIKGSVTQAGREDLIEVFAVDHNIMSPRDVASGRPTGKRQHSPVRLVCPVDKATPILYNALVNNESLPTAAISFYKTMDDGMESEFFTIELTNATVSKMAFDAPHLKDPAMGPYPDMVNIELHYQKIVWTWQDGGIMGEDDWEAPRA
jgi:type VI secretion system secreted protein Hcp